MANKQQQPHFLLVTFAAQGHINPSRLLARSLARHAGARVTISTSISAHRRMFPHTSDQEPPESAEEEGGLVTYIPYYDGMKEEGLDAETQLPLIRQRIVQSLTGITSDLAARGQPVTCVIYALIMTMAIDVARELSVPCILLWIQPASVFSIYYHYFNRGYDKIIGASSAESSAVLELPGLPLLRMEDLPSFLVHRPSDGTTDPYSVIYNLLQEVFQTVEKEMSRGSSKRPKVLLNTFDELEAGPLSSIGDVEMIAVGPLVPPALLGHLDSEPASNSTPGDLFDHDSKAYIEWLDSKEEKSVAYVSFGSLAMLSKRQMEEISRGLDECGRPYIWVVRKDLLKKQNNDQEGGEIIACNVSGEGMVVEWCNQASVLSHRAVGCFVTHCGWNSTLESMACGVPMVLLPQWTDQATNARLVEGEWGMGVRAKVSGEGIVESSELRKCLDAVMGEGEGDGDGGERGSDMRRSAETWKCKAKAAVGEGGSSVQNIVKFVEDMM